MNQAKTKGHLGLVGMVLVGEGRSKQPGKLAADEEERGH